MHDVVAVVAFVAFDNGVEDVAREEFSKKFQSVNKKKNYRKGKN
jgi:hypothetical protein